MKTKNGKAGREGTLRNKGEEFIYIFKALNICTLPIPFVYGILCV